MLFRSFLKKRWMLTGVIAFSITANTALHSQDSIIPSNLGTAPLTSDTTPNNTLSYGAAAVNSFDDNVSTVDGAGRETNFTTSFAPRASLTIDRTHWISNFSYSPIFTYSNNINYSSSTSQGANGDVHYRFTKRLSLDLKESFVLSTNPSASYQANAGVPTIGILTQSQAALVGANVRSTTNQSQTDLVYRLGPHTVIGIGGTFTYFEYKPIVNSSLTSNLAQTSRGWSGNAFYFHQLTSKYSFGAQYTAQHLSSDFALGQSLSLSHQTLGFLNISFKPTITLSVFAGPEFTDLDYNLVTPPLAAGISNSSFAGGSSFSWQGEHNGLNASFVQQVGTAGLGGVGSVTTRTASLQLQRALTRTSTIGLSGNSNFNRQIITVGLPTPTNSASVGITYSKTITDRLSFDFSVMRQQFIDNVLPGFNTRSHDLASATLSYSWRRPIGR